MDKWNFARFFAAVGSNSTRWTSYGLGSDERGEVDGLQTKKVSHAKHPEQMALSFQPIFLLQVQVKRNILSFGPVLQKKYAFNAPTEK